MPIIFNGTDCKLKEKLKIEIEPVFSKEAKAIIQTKAMLLNAKPRVLGKEIKTTFLISLKSILKENFGLKPQPEDAIAWIRKCKKAPNATPKAKPFIPQFG